MVKLTSSDIQSFTSPECAHDRYWNQYLTSAVVAQLPASHYRTALAIRCKLIPDFISQHVKAPFRCNCNHAKLLYAHNLLPEQEEATKNNNQLTPVMEHVINCPHLHKIYYNARHDYVKDALRYVANKYAIRSTVEPNFYVYESGQLNRPDITFHLQGRPYVATDVTVVQPATSTDTTTSIGVEAGKAAEAKVAKHSDAVTKFGHQFIPFALETTGHFEQGCYTLINILANAVAYENKINFIRDIKGAVSTALARYRAEVLLATLSQVRTSS